jgi:ABC-type siderophore export system fused ATPase/permease subunit
MDFQLFMLAATVVLMLVTVATKYISTLRLVRHRERLHEVETELHALRGRLKVVDNEKAIARSNEKNLNNQKTRLEKRIPNLKKELRSLDR